MSVLNQYSFVVISFIALSLSIVALRRYNASWSVSLGAALTLAALLLAGYFLLRPGASDAENAGDAFALIESSGKPTVLEFFSNFCAGCLAVRPVVDRLAAEIADEFNVLRVDIHTEPGLTLRARYRFSYTPEFVVFDRTGREVWRAHVPPDEAALNLARTG
ncbi:MAG: TlpA family protein disulfide reductase [Aggregatilineales bacterium]